MKTIIIVAVLAILLSPLAATSVDAQKPRRRSPTAKATPKATTTPRQESVLSVEAGLVFKSGDVKPVARVTFYLLDKDLEEIINDAGIKDTSPSGNLKGVQLYAFLNVRKRRLGTPSNALAQAEDAISPHIITSMTTDFGGKGEFLPVTPGSYFIMGVGGPADQTVVWNMPVTLKAGKQSVTLDQDNAAEIF